MSVEITTLFLKGKTKCVVVIKCVGTNVSLTVNKTQGAQLTSFSGWSEYLGEVDTVNSIR